MVEKIITFGHIETDKHWIHCYESPEIEKKKSHCYKALFFRYRLWLRIGAKQNIRMMSFFRKQIWKCLFEAAILKMSFLRRQFLLKIFENVFFKGAV